ncbi:nonsense-mediated mRNA decay factor, putative [Ichthyophthirius multifiliis]|uniref:Nonsense-mediated mRNA decay factor, putative n=1 Tax=Ichthyophthirius multifiliis TaxID=5932 RepID=G0R6H6_ICHMU|nr:nonsense-mediated mRNA decay factor, putative [Ichthyophthirius multifiliis]EGR26931.1 nonsense-mediated mRNA decay factor, putative [Ichthyophthirius multifiliis]|eukprot:XP_004023815.1 nonsense-mediated mRNA decay factor, putative [Ichthyophthirius multifiliis]
MKQVFLFPNKILYLKQILCTFYKFAQNQTKVMISSVKQYKTDQLDKQLQELLKKKKMKIQQQNEEKIHLDFQLNYLQLDLKYNLEKIVETLKDIIQHQVQKDYLLNIQTAVMFAQNFGFEICSKRGIKINKQYNTYDDLPNIFDFDVLISKEKTQKLIFWLQMYVNNFIEILRNFYDIKIREDKKVNRLIAENGGITDRQEALYQKIRTDYVTLYENLNILCDCLEFEFNVNFAQEKQLKNQQKAQEEQRRKKQEEDELLRKQNASYFDTEEERSFYEEIFDLKSKLPPILFKEKLNYGIIFLQFQNILKINIYIFQFKEDEDYYQPEEIIENIDNKEEDENEEFSGEFIPKTYEEFRNKLKFCTSKETADLLAEQFMYVNNKVNRRRLIQDILTNSQQYRHLITYFTRLVAVINLHFQDIGDYLSQKVNDLLENQQNQKKQDIIRMILYLNNLTKFGIVESFKILNYLKYYVDDFHIQQLDFICLIIGECGRFLFKNQNTQFRYQTIVDHFLSLIQNNNQFQNYIQEWVQKNIQQNNQSSQFQIDINLNIIQQYVSYILFVQLNQINFEDVKISLLKLDWDEELELYLLVSFLNSFRPTLVEKIIDLILIKLFDNQENNVHLKFIYIDLLGDLETEDQKLISDTFQISDGGSQRLNQKNLSLEDLNEIINQVENDNYQFSEEKFQTFLGQVLLRNKQNAQH